MGVGSTGFADNGFNRRMSRRIDARRPDGQFAPLQGFKKAGHVLDLGVRANTDDTGEGGIEIEVPVPDRCVQLSGHRIGAEILRGSGRPGVTVARRIEGGLGPDRSGRAGLIDDHNGLTERLCHLVGDNTADLIGCAAGAPGHDEGDRLFRPFGQRRRGGDERRGEHGFEEFSF